MSFVANITIPVTVHQDVPDVAVLEALDALAAVMAVQAEDGLYTLGYKEAEAPDVENDFVAELSYAEPKVVIE